jgi:uncharacterized RDD family membrane protein YckC
MAGDAFMGSLQLGGASPAGNPVATADEQPGPREGLLAPQVAVRARLNAIILDLLVLGAAVRALAAGLGHSVSPATELLLFAALQFAYFFALESRGGQTIGKRVFHVRVATLTGARPTNRQVAVRNVLRVLDALPLLYASGLISLMRTGRARRQRIGDVLAGTTVVLDDAGKPLPTPRWLLPGATILATLVSIAVIVPIVNHRESSPPPASGFARPER